MGASNAMSPTTSKASSIEDAMPVMEEIRTKESKAQQKQPENGNALHLVQSHLLNHDMPVTTEFREVDEEQYLRFSPPRKIVIVAVLSFCSFLAPISSTSILSGIPEVAATYDTTGSIINASNALYLAFMGIAAPFWGPFSQVWGRRPVSQSIEMIPQLITYWYTNRENLDFLGQRISFLCFQHWHCPCPKLARILHISCPHGFPRNFIPGSR